MSSAGDRVRLSDLESIRRALDAGDPLARLLVREGERSKSVEALVERARARGIDVATESAREMRRMSQTADAPEVLGMGGEPPTRDLDELMRRPGLVLVLVELRYPANVGFILRSAEVAGAAGVVVAGAWQGEEWNEARRVSMRADRFLSVVEADAQRACDAARAAGRRLVALETEGRSTPWDSDLTKPFALLIGGEASGLSTEILARSDEVLRIPTRGFIPSYNVQAATGILLGEYLRQTASNDVPRPLASRSTR